MRRAVELAVQLSRCPPCSLEERGIEQERTPVGESAKVRVWFSTARTAKQSSRASNTRGACIQVEVAPEILELLAPPIQQLGKPAIEFHPEMICQDSFAGISGTLNAFSSAWEFLAVLPREIALDTRGHGQQGLAADAIDEFAIAGYVDEKRAASIRFGIAAYESRRQSPAS